MKYESIPPSQDDHNHTVESWHGYDAALAYEYKTSHERMMDTAVKALDAAEAGITDINIKDILDLTEEKTFRGHAMPWNRADNDTTAVSMSAFHEQDYIGLLLDTAVKSSSLAEKLVSFNIGGLHASGSSALLSTLKHGLTPLKTLRERGDVVHNGARDAIGDMVMQGTSFLPVQEGIYRAEQYAGRPITPEVTLQNLTDLRNLQTYLRTATGRNVQSLMTNCEHTIADLERTYAYITTPPANQTDAENLQLVTENYPAIWALSLDGLSGSQMSRVRGEHKEFVVRQLDQSSAPLVFVPRSKVDDVQRLAGREQSPVTAVAIEDFPPLAARLARNPWIADETMSQQAAEQYL
jgi:hypothetical protein